MLKRILRIKNEIGEGNAEKGFSLFEMLIVLFFLVIVLATLPPFFYSTMNTIERNHVLNQLRADLYLAQQTAITKQTAVSFRYDSLSKKYEFRMLEQKLLLSRKLPDQVDMWGHMTNFYFHPNGNVSKFGNLGIRIGEKKYRIFFSIGKGRFAIYETKDGK
ncbi:competence type IV pilus minor pilin ComGD [Fervidibacillus halotolerans]|uniref:Competence type IV pilus minor pilin ComGD n=1 Tax=Fervidibacillus halotolerans TaxID=2980027 RepID=A0A9E8RZ95_9BACI|nr:competence type IV pilus minor pilin ComGD [Fervidibacillus halotolerans]WAA11447.1 competence type IV pilus minor pilin ComGD [Fervidibacillus halotolerans]